LKRKDKRSIGEREWEEKPFRCVNCHYGITFLGHTILGDKCIYCGGDITENEGLNEEKNNN
jgi:uncharacterized protein (DUF983 family)